jgi:hypothetical protein
VRQISLAVVGADYPNKRGPGRRFELAICAPGERVELRPEPDNPADEFAVAVYSCRGIQIGYLTAERAPWIGGMLKSGREIIAAFQEESTYGAVVRAAFDGDEPLLPQKRMPSPPNEDDGFWPDPVYPDE